MGFLGPKMFHSSNALLEKKKSLLARRLWQIDLLGHHLHSVKTFLPQLTWV